jgi:hypothetical protein
MFHLRVRGVDMFILVKFAVIRDLIYHVSAELKSLSLNRRLPLANHTSPTLYLIPRIVSARLLHYLLCLRYIQNANSDMASTTVKSVGLY